MDSKQLMRRALPLLVLLAGCASVPAEDERLDVDASLVVKTVEVARYRVLIKNSSDDPVTIERVDLQPFGGSQTSRAFVNTREAIAPGELKTFMVTTETNARDLSRVIDEIGGPADIKTTSGRAGKPGARIYVTFSDGTNRKTASYKVEL